MPKAVQPSAEPVAAPASAPVRLRRADREREIVREAVRYFSEVGFVGDTTALARRLGVAQALLYRYFENKEALIARVFEETFLANWNPLWEEMIGDRNNAVPTRLVTFHRDFARVHLQRERVRLSLFFALRGWDMSPYFRLMHNRVYQPIAATLREHTGRPNLKPPFSVEEIEVAKTVVEKIQYYGIRQWVYELPVPPIDPLIHASVRLLLGGAHDAFNASAAALSSR